MIKEERGKAKKERKEKKEGQGEAGVWGSRPPGQAAS